MKSNYEGYGWPKQDREQILPGFLTDVQASGAHSILDIGCGDGWLTVQCTEFADSVLGIDPDTRMIEKARKLHTCEGVWYQVLDAQSIDEVCGTFDLAISTLALQMLGSEEKLRAMFRKVPTSHVIAVVPHPFAVDKNESYAQYFFSREFNYHKGGKYDVYLNSGKSEIHFPCQHLPLSAYINAAVSGGFAIERVREYGGVRQPYFLQMNLRR